MSRIEGWVLACCVALLVTGIVLMAVYLPPSSASSISSTAPLAVTTTRPARLPVSQTSTETAQPAVQDATGVESEPRLTLPRVSVVTPQSAARVLRSLTVPEPATSLYWNNDRRLLLVGTPDADQGYGRVYTYQIHPDLLASGSADDPDLAFRPARSWPFFWSGHPRQRAGYRVRDHLVWAPDSTPTPTSTDPTGALYYLDPDQGSIQRLNLDTQDQYRLADHGVVFCRFPTGLAVAKRQSGHRSRVDVFAFAPQDGPPQFQASLIDPSASSAPDFGHSILWHPQHHRLHISAPSVGQLYSWDWNERLREWTLADTWDFSTFSGSDASDLSFWPEHNVVVLSCPGTATTYLVQYATWDVLDTLPHRTHHKLSHHQLLVWNDHQLQLYGTNTVYASDDPILDAEAVGSNRVVVLHASAALVWIQV